MPGELTNCGTGLALADYTRPELIVPWLRSSDPAGIIGELTQRLCAQNIIGNLLAFYHAAINHELLSSSALPAGLAIPHARSIQVPRLRLAFGRTRRPVVWGGKGALLVEQVFLLAVPSTNAGECLTLLSAIAGLTRRPAALSRLQTATDEREIFESLQDLRVAGDSPGRVPNARW